MKFNRVSILLILTVLLFGVLIAFRTCNNHNTKKEVEEELSKYLDLNEPDYEGAEFFLDQEMRNNPIVTDDKALQKKLGRIRVVIELNKF